jgi:flagellar basal-body rod protein FlgG
MEQGRMNSGVYIALSGAKFQELRLETISNNLANASTSGYKSERITGGSFEFELERAYEDISMPSDIAELNLDNVPFNGTYSKTSRAYTEFVQGEQKHTGNSLDMSLNGPGFFVLETANGLRYTRDGSFALNGKGDLVTVDGYRLRGKGLTDLGKGILTVDEDGSISIDGKNAGSIDVVEFENPGVLKKEGNNLFVAPAGMGFEKRAKDTKVTQGSLEMPGTNVVKEMVNLIEINRLYETYQKTIVSIDESTRAVIEEVGG